MQSKANQRTPNLFQRFKYLHSKHIQSTLTGSDPIQRLLMGQLMGHKCLPTNLYAHLNQKTNRFSMER